MLLAEKEVVVLHLFILYTSSWTKIVMTAVKSGHLQSQGKYLEQDRKMQ